MMPAEIDWFRAQIENRETDSELVMWEFARLPIDGSPKFACTVQPGQFQLFGLLNLSGGNGEYFGEGRLEIPLGMYDEDSTPRSIASFIKSNRACFAELDSLTIARALGIKLDFAYGGNLKLSSHGGSERLYGFGWSFDLIRSFYRSSMNTTDKISIPKDHHTLVAIGALGFVRNIRLHLPHLQITPLSSELFLSTPI